MWNFEIFDKIALISDNGKQMSYAELQREADRLGKVIEKRCLVFSLCTNSIGSVVGYVGFMRNRIVPLLLSGRIDKDFFTILSNTYHPSYIWMPEELEKEYFFGEKCYSKFHYVLVKTKFTKSYPMNEELGQLITTSGSTGSPKLVRQTYENIRINAKQMAKYLELDSTDRPVTSVPMNYTYGCSMLNCHFLVGATILLTDSSIMTKKFWDFIKNQKATSFDGVPYTYEMLERIRFFKMELPYLRRMTEAGGKISLELQKKFAQYALEKNKKFIIMYGASEATAAMGYLPADKVLEKCGSCGIAVDGGNYKLLDEDGKCVQQPETKGELVYTGKNVTMGYAQCGEDLLKGDVFCGRHYTGDIAKYDKDGFYYIVGRKKRFLKIYGNRVSLDEIDSMLKEKFSFIDCATTGVDDNMYVCVTDDTMTEEIRTYLCEKTKLNINAFHVIRVTEIPKNDAGKVLYNELSSYARESIKLK